MKTDDRIAFFKSLNGFVIKACLLAVLLLPFSLLFYAALLEQHAAFRPRIMLVLCWAYGLVLSLPVLLLSGWMLPWLLRRGRGPLTAYGVWYGSVVAAQMVVIALFGLIVFRIFWFRMLLVTATATLL